MYPQHITSNTPIRQDSYDSISNDNTNYTAQYTIPSIPTTPSQHQYTQQHNSNTQRNIHSPSPSQLFADPQLNDIYALNNNNQHINTGSIVDSSPIPPYHTNNDLSKLIRHISDSSPFTQSSNSTTQSQSQQANHELLTHQLHQLMNGQAASQLAQYTQLPVNTPQFNAATNNTNNNNKYYDPLMMNDISYMQYSNNNHNNTNNNNANATAQIPLQMQAVYARPLGPVGMACLPCYNAKTSCSGHRPCHRCLRLGRGEECNDRPHKRRRPRTTKQNNTSSNDNTEQEKETKKRTARKCSVKHESVDDTSVPQIKTESVSSDDDHNTTNTNEDTTDYTAYEAYDASLEDEDDVAAENRIMSAVVLELLIKLIPQLTQYLVKSKLPHVVTLNVIFSYFAQALQPNDFDELVTAMMSKPQLMEIIQNADPDSQLIKRRYIWDYTDSPGDAFPDQPIVPNIATVLNTSLNIHPNRFRWQPQNSMTTTNNNNNHSHTNNNNNTNSSHSNNSSNNHKQHIDTAPSSPTDAEITTNGAANINNKSSSDHTSDSTDSTATSPNRAVIGSKAVVQTQSRIPDERSAAVIEQVTVHSDAVDVGSMLHSLLQNPDTLSMKKCIVVNREFERVFGFSQEDIRNIHIRRSSMGMWSLSIGFHKYRQARNLAKMKQRTLAADAAKYKKLLADARIWLKNDIQRMWLQHHQASVQGITQFSQQVTMVTKHNVEIPCVMTVRYGHNQDGVTSTTATQFTIIPPDDGVLR